MRVRIEYRKLNAAPSMRPHRRLGRELEHVRRNAAARQKLLVIATLSVIGLITVLPFQVTTHYSGSTRSASDQFRSSTVLDASSPLFARATAAGLNRFPVTTRLHAASAHSFPFVIYHVFCAERDGCARTTFIGQLEGACDARRAILERAGIDDWQRWRQDFAREMPGCNSCVASKTASRIKRSIASSKVDLEQRSGGIDRDHAYYCGFISRSQPHSLLASTRTTTVTKRVLKFRSTVIFSCYVPSSLRSAVLSGDTMVALGRSKASLQEELENGDFTRRNASRSGMHPMMDIIVQQNLSSPVTRVAACAWVKGGSYSDRMGRWQHLPAARVAEWLAHHFALGVDHFAIFDNSDSVYSNAIERRANWSTVSPLWGALSPFIEAGIATLAPWPTLVRDEVVPGCSTADLEERVAAATDGTKTTQSYFGRPSQYAAQNACHLRMIAAGARAVLHVDVDEFIIPRQIENVTVSTRSPGSEAPHDAPLVAIARYLGSTQRSALSMPCVFYAPCQGTRTVGGSTSLLLDDASCAGKVAMFRQKLIASATALHRKWLSINFVSPIILNLYLLACVLRMHQSGSITSAWQQRKLTRYFIGC